MCFISIYIDFLHFYVSFSKYINLYLEIWYMSASKQAELNSFLTETKICMLEQRGICLQFYYKDAEAFHKFLCR